MTSPGKRLAAAMSGVRNVLDLNRLLGPGLPFAGNGLAQIGIVHHEQLQRRQGSRGVGAGGRRSRGQPVNPAIKQRSQADERDAGRNAWPLYE